MARVFLIVMDSVGCGGAPDADRFFNGDTPDAGANTLAHIAQACAAGQATAGRTGPLQVPHLDGLGLGAAIRLASGAATPGLSAKAMGLWGAATEVSNGKDTPSGHWELAGVPVPWDWHIFPKADPAFPVPLVERVKQLAGVDGILGNCHASGTLIVDRLGAEHMRTGWPICYTSVDSVFQIAAHETTFGLERLLNLCNDLAPELHAKNLGRVIARPFVGDAETGFTRTANRRDFAMAPPAPTICDQVSASGGAVHAIGKIGDIFSMQGIADVVKGTDAELMTALIAAMDSAQQGSLTFANFVEFDSLYGHRRDVSGYARALEWFDAHLPTLFSKARKGDMILFTADHGNDPTWTGTDHTRERVPVVGYGVGQREIGLIPFTGVADLVADHLGLEGEA